LEFKSVGGGVKRPPNSELDLPGNRPSRVKKNVLKPWKKKRYCIPERDAARVVAQMEDSLDLYTAGHRVEEPLIGMDEASKQLLAQVYEPLPLRPGQVAKEDYHYERQGVRALFMFFDPLRGWRRVSSREHRARVDWAEEIKTLLDEDYPQAPKVKLVCDNLNTPHIASLYGAFEPAEAHCLARRLEIHYTPRHGSWLNVAEIELSVLSEHCLNRRISDDTTLRAELAAWQEARNADASTVTWRFTTKEARIKLRHLYPVRTKLE
jgi:DDE superfamily endonuclease